MTTDTAQLSIRAAALGVAVVIVQIAAISQIALFGVNPDLLPLYVASVGMLAGPVAGAIAGFGAGLMVDLALVQTLGVSSLVFVAVGYLAGRARDARDPHAALLPVAVGAAATLVATVGFSLLQFLLGVEAPVSLELLRQILLTVVINSLVALPFHAIVRRVLAPALPAVGRRRRAAARPALSPFVEA